jgi:hypothetical protein
MSSRSACFHRRDLLKVGSLGAIGLGLPELIARRAHAAEDAFGRAKSCLLMFLEGGPAQHDMWDMKPDAPAEVRGEFRPIASSVAGIDICEHMPLLAEQMHHVALIPSVHHSIVDHNAGTYYAIAGRNPVVNGRLIVRAATTYWSLGIDPLTHIEVPLGRPHVLALGEPIFELFA